MLLSNCHTNEIGTATRKLKDGTQKEFDCPEAIIFYNNYMAGVDKSDQYSTYYEVDRKSTKWWKRVFYRLLNVAVSNAWIIYKKFQTKELSLIDFLVPLAENLIEVGKEGTKNRRRSDMGHASKRAKLANDVDHEPVRQSSKHRCKYCSIVMKKQSRTLYKCNFCQVFLCAKCFEPYHK